MNYSSFNKFHITLSNYNYTVILQEFSIQLRCTYIEQSLSTKVNNKRKEGSNRRGIEGGEKKRDGIGGKKR